MPDPEDPRDARLAALRARVDELERECRARRQVLSVLGDELLIAFWVADRRTGALVYSGGPWRRVVGREPEPGLAPEALLDAVVPADQPRLGAACRAPVDDGTEESLRLQAPDGTERRLLLRTFVVRGAEDGEEQIVGVVEDVTEARASEAALRGSEARYRSLFENAPVALFRTRVDGGAVLDLNRKFEQLFGLSREQLMSRRGASWWANPEDRAAVRQLLVERGHVQDYECVMEVRPGDRMHVLASATIYPEEGYIEGSVVDITARKRAELALQRSEARLALIFKATTDLQVLVRVDGPDTFVMEEANPAFRRYIEAVFGADVPPEIDRAEFLRRLGVTAEAIEGELPMYRGAVEAQSPVEYELEAPTPGGGAAMLLQVRIEPIVGAEGGVTHVLWSARDVAERRRVDAQLRASLREKEVLLREIHHRVKNNLEVVSTLLYLQAERAHSQEVVACFHDSRARIASMALIHDQLYQSADLSRISFGEHARLLVTALRDSYGVPEDRVRTTVHAEGVELSLATAVPCGLLLTELITNALKHAFPMKRCGSIVVRVSRDPAERGRFELSVVDDGVGLPSDYRERRAGALGMVLVERLAAQLRGAVQVESSGRGTAFSVTFHDLDRGVHDPSRYPGALP